MKKNSLAHQHARSAEKHKATEMVQPGDSVQQTLQAIRIEKRGSRDSRINSFQPSHQRHCTGEG
jgi:hypothetical protein